MRDKIITELKQVTRPGMNDLLGWLLTTDFFTAPASTKYHLCRPGGLAEHSWNVYKCLEDICERNHLGVSQWSIVLCSLLHDVCKTNFYVKQMDGTYKVKDQLPLGHGEKSLYLISQHIELEPCEALAIRWHMGAWDAENKMTLGQAMNQSKLLKALMLADQEATWFKEDK